MNTLQLLAAPRRREILRLVWHRELQAQAIHAALADVTFGAISQHLRRLRDAGLVTVRRSGRARYYRATPQTLQPEFRAWLEQSWDDALYRLKLQAELDQARRGPLPHSSDAPKPTPARPSRATSS